MLATRRDTRREGGVEPPQPGSVLVLAGTGFRVTKWKAQAEAFASARVLLSLVVFGNHVFCLLFQRNKTTGHAENKRAAPFCAA